MPKVFLASDSHYGHSAIILYGGRPFSPPQEVVDAYASAGRPGYWTALANNQNAAVGMQEACTRMNDYLVECYNAIVSEDDVLVHLGDWAFGKSAGAEFRCRLRTKRVFLVRGNHDKNISRTCFDAVVNSLQVGDDVIRHKPIAGYNGPGRILHGHVHKVSSYANCVNLTPESLGHYFPVTPESVGLDSGSVLMAIDQHCRKAGGVHK